MAEKELQLKNVKQKVLRLPKRKEISFCRPRIEMCAWNTVYHQWQSQENTAVKAQEILEISASTFYRRVQQNAKNKEEL